MSTEQLPSLLQLLLKIPLYKPISFDEKDLWGVIEYLYTPITYDAYCVGCKQTATFRITPTTPRLGDHKREVYAPISPVIGARDRVGEIPKPGIEKGVYTIKAQCTRTEGHRHIFTLHVDSDRQQFLPYGTKLPKGTVTKIGQYPSFADLNISDIDKFKSVLSKQDRQEILRAWGLAAHDVGIVAFVYLRRVFERLVEEAHQEALIIDSGFDETTYQRYRMDEKIDMLKPYLPSYLCENAKIYSILSKGIHELSEDECNEYFIAVNGGIELILGEKLRKMNEEKAKAAIGNDLAKIYQKLKDQEKRNSQP